MSDETKKVVFRKTFQWSPNGATLTKQNPKDVVDLPVKIAESAINCGAASEVTAQKAPAKKTKAKKPAENKAETPAEDKAE